MDDVDGHALAGGRTAPAVADRRHHGRHASRHLGHVVHPHGAASRFRCPAMLNKHFVPPAGAVSADEQGDTGPCSEQGRTLSGAGPPPVSSSPLVPYRNTAPRIGLAPAAPCFCFTHHRLGQSGWMNAVVPGRPCERMHRPERVARPSREAAEAPHLAPPRGPAPRRASPRRCEARTRTHRGVVAGALWKSTPMRRFSRASPARTGRGSDRASPPPPRVPDRSAPIGRRPGRLSGRVCRVLPPACSTG